MSLKKDLVTGRMVGLALEEVVESHLVQGGRAGVCGEMAADPIRLDIGSGNHNRGVPADVSTNAALHLLVTGKPGLEFRWNGVDVRRGYSRRKADLRFARGLKQAGQDEGRSGLSSTFNKRAEGIDPFGSLLLVYVWNLVGESVNYHPSILASFRARVTFLGPEVHKMGFLSP